LRGPHCSIPLIELYLSIRPPLITRSNRQRREARRGAAGGAPHFQSSTANLGGLRLAALVKECEDCCARGVCAKARRPCQGFAGNIKTFCSALMQEHRRAPPKAQEEHEAKSDSLYGNRAVVDDDPGARLLVGSPLEVAGSKF